MGEQIKTDWHQSKIDRKFTDEWMNVADWRRFAQVIPRLKLDIATGMMARFAVRNDHANIWQTQ